MQCLQTNEMVSTSQRADILAHSLPSVVAVGFYICLHMDSNPLLPTGRHETCPWLALICTKAVAGDWMENWNIAFLPTLAKSNLVNLPHIYFYSLVFFKKDPL